MASTAYQPFDSRQPERWDRPREEAERLGAALPPLLVEAERLTSGVWLGVHGRRKAGMGETFWQFRRYRVEDPATSVDWRQSAKSQHVYVREREWEAAETVWFWRDASASMRYASLKAVPEKWERATVLSLALASLLTRGGERIGLLGTGAPPSSGRIALRRMAHRLSHPGPGEKHPPPPLPLQPPRSMPPNPRSRAWPIAAPTVIWCRSSILPKRIFPSRAAPGSRLVRSATPR